MNFEKIKDEHFDLIAKAQSKTEYNGSEYSLLYLKGWDFFNYQSMQIASEDDMIFLRFIPHRKYRDDEYSEKYIYLPPLCIKEKIVRAYEKIEQQCAADGQSVYVMATPREYVDILGDKYDYVNNEDYSEYLYDPKSLITFAGKKYHSKRNHVANFIKNYNPSYDGDCRFREYVAQDREKVFALINGWEERKEFDRADFDSMANEEINVISLALNLVAERKGYFADVIEYEDKIIGFTLGEITPSNVGITHIEKADVAYDGIYSYLCNSFAAKRFADVRYINRQEDMGLEGLRKSKRSYHPVGFCEKYVVKSRG